MAERKPKEEREEKLAAESVEEKKPRRRRKTEKEDKLEAEAVKPETEAADTSEPEPEPEPDADADNEEESGDDKPKRRRGSAQTTASETKKSPPPRSPDGDVAVRATARYVRCAPRKARLVIDHIRGKDVEQARAILTHTPRAASQDVLRLLNSAIANAENNHELVADELRVKQIVVNEGPTLKRYRPRALGRATRINKRTSHLSITLSPKE